MRILIVNPNTSSEFTQSIQQVADFYKRPDTVVNAVSPQAGPHTIETRYEQLLSSQPALELILEKEGQFDGLVIACYGDHPVAYAARELTDKPVVGITEAAMYTAALLGELFSIVTTDERWEPLLWESVRRFGMQNFCASVRTTGLGTGDFEGEDEAVYQRLLEVSRQAVEQDGAEVICLGCAGMAGLDKKLQTELGVPVVDGVVAALKMVEGFLEYGLNTSKRRTYAPPPPKEMPHLPKIFVRK